MEQAVFDQGDENLKKHVNATEPNEPYYRRTNHDDVVVKKVRTGLGVHRIGSCGTELVNQLAHNTTIR